MARRVFPCWDVPGLKAIFNISINHSKYFIPFSNMPILFTNNYSTDACRTYFYDTPLISPLNVFIAVLKHNDKFQTRNMSKNDLIWYISQRQMLEYAMNTIALDNYFLTTITNLTDVLPKRNHIFFPNNTIKTMGSIGLMIYSEKDVLYNRDFDFPGQKVYISQVISHQMVRQLFTAVVTQSRWADQWIGESLSKLYCFALLRMIEHMITRDKFQLAVETYLDKFRFRSTTPYDFWITFQRLLDDTQNEKFKIKEIMDTWLTQRYYPVMQVFHDRENNTMILNITHSVSMTKSTWIVPITYILYHSMGDIISDIWITSSDIVTINLPIEENINFVIFNIKHNGYFRVNYDYHSWLSIKNFLNTDGYDKIDVRNRAQLIDDAYYFMTQGYVSSTIFWGLANYLKNDVNYIAWYPMFNILSFMWPVWDHPEAELMKGHVRQMLGGLLEHLGYEERDGEDNMQKTLRLLATRWACKLGDMKCQRVAARKLSRYLSDRNNEK
ncbi:Glutamyl aminopeptidase [Harpegnathos saltator]|uniref:Glutamyl aminopeptidase n=1 Tax=Harpegnathos saltator TaxID=610380 RepID=E2BF37_HARSA|nr:Glutamyl aminopeptidase [Harpegnathos saltator]